MELHILTVSKDEPKDAKRSSNPSGTKGLLVTSDSIQYLGPVLAGEDDIHANERVENVVEWYADRLAIS